MGHERCHDQGDSDHDYGEKVLRKMTEHHDRGCRNLPFGGRATRDSRVCVPRKEYARSRHQHLFEENVEKTGKDVIYEL